MLNTENKVQAVVGYGAGDRGRVLYAKPRNLHFILYAPGVGRNEFNFEPVEFKVPVRYSDRDARLPSF